MSFSIPENKIDEVREATDVFDFISGYVTLKKSGQNFFGLCPFHAEKTPSFSVNQEKQIFHCFGCGAGGNVFTFLMRHEGIGFVEAVKFLAQRAGIVLELEQRDADASSSKEIESLFHVNEFAADFFKKYLTASHGQKVIGYLNKRGFGEEEIEAFGLGYAPSGWNNLVKHAESAAVDLELLTKAGLILRKGDGSYYDRFRDRLMFNIRNLSGRVVAFAGRKLNDAEDSPKYINSPETSIYQKGKLLYGLFQNRNEIRKQDGAIFVEGYTDLMSLVRNGIGNVVATSGTALTEDQARLIHRYTKKIILMYDSDTAGSAATLRGADVLLENGLNVFVAILPEGHDPDSFMREYGQGSVMNLLQEATSLFDFKLERALEQSPEQRGEAIRSILESLAKLPQSIDRGLKLRHVAERLQIPEKILWEELESKLRYQNRRKKTPSRMSQQFEDLSRVSKKKKIDVATEDLVKILIHDWDRAESIFDQLDFKDIGESDMLPILEFLKNRFKGGKRPNQNDLIHQFTDITHSNFIVTILNEKFDDVNLARWATDCLMAIKRSALQKELDVLREQLRQTQEAGQSTKELLHRCLELEEQKKALKEQPK